MGSAHLSMGQIQIVVWIWYLGQVQWYTIQPYGRRQEGGKAA